MQKWCLACLSIIVAACHQHTYEVKGTAEGFDDGDVLVVEKGLESAFVADTILVRDGVFSYEGRADSALFMVIRSLKYTDVEASFIAEPGITAQVSISSDGIIVVGGTKANEAWQELTEVCNAYSRQVEQLAETFYQEDVGQEQLEDLSLRVGRLKEQMGFWLEDFGKRNADNAAGKFLQREAVWK